MASSTPPCTSSFLLFLGYMFATSCFLGCVVFRGRRIFGAGFISPVFWVDFLAVRTIVVIPRRLRLYFFLSIIFTINIFSYCFFIIRYSPFILYIYVFRISPLCTSSHTPILSPMHLQPHSSGTTCWLLAAAAVIHNEVRISIRLEPCHVTGMMKSSGPGRGRGWG